MSNNTTRFAYIDALRGYAVLGVVLVHASQQFKDYQGGLFATGARGVQLFFVVSAITLMSSWHQRADGTTAFFIRRAFRILPMFWIAIPVYWNSSFGIGQTIAAAALLQTLRPDWLVAPLIPGGWSVCTEAAFYFLFPWIANKATTLRKAFVFLIVAFIISAIWRVLGFEIFPIIFPWAKDDAGIFLSLTIPKQLPVFAAGIVAYFLIPYFSNLSRQTLEIIFVSTVIASVWCATYHEYNYPAFGAIFAIGSVCMANGAGRYVVNEVVRHIGRCSFSIYLLHFKFLGVAIPFTERFSSSQKLAASFLVTVTITTALSTVTYFIIERPMIRLGNRIIERIHRLNDANNIVADDERRKIIHSGLRDATV
jgi:peptidoglycan/LPS O-acetylase OafA/YrhL